ncbi:DNA repair protein Rad60 isoform X2 [Anoplolepis gracilipes]|uniref:DNA repair protein Rad60 isoform X2 n=1 Tax=Anoplolepis gracilipes TaxID=354296 RepID=UPI003B9E54FD
MNKMAVDDSSDEDDPYTNFAGRLKALKQKRFKKEEPSAEIDIFSIDIEEQKNGEQSSKEDKINKKETNDKEIYDDDRQIQRRMQYVQPVDDLECDIEIVLTEEKPESIPNTCNNDVISLSDDEVSIKDDNYEINIKVLWRSKRIDRLNIHRNDNFEKIFQYYADLEKVSVNEILIMKKDKIINRTDTPASLKLSIIDILDGGIVHPGMNALSEDKKNDDDEDTCTIKVQTANKKQSLTIPLKRDQQFKALFINCAEQLGIKESSLKFYFDGEQISLTDTPNSLDLEGEACIDLHIAT